MSIPFLNFFKKVFQKVFTVLYKEKVRTKTYGLLEAPPGFEPGIRVLQTHALPLGYSADGADYEARTRYLHLGKVALYQMS